MKINKKELKQIIKEEISNALVEFDLDSELASIGTDADLVNKKQAHRDVSLGLLQASTALKLMLQLSIVVRNKKSKFFAKQMPHGPNLANFDQIKKLANILSTVSKQVREPRQSLEENYQESELEFENKRIKELIDFIKNLGTEMKQIGYGGMTPDEREVDNLILGKLKLGAHDFNEIIEDHIYATLEQFRDLESEELVPENLRDYLRKAIDGYIFRPMKQKASRGY